MKFVPKQMVLQILVIVELWGQGKLAAERYIAAVSHCCHLNLLTHPLSIPSNSLDLNACAQTQSCFIASF